ncbi:MAG TPA: DinB family protein [Candidatus Dormibacteraeota bacterium]|jgi:hypothetical protein
MKIESPSFTLDDIHSFMSSYREHERDLLADRLQAVSERLTLLEPLIGTSRQAGEEWSAHEVLAHIAVVSKFYGVVVHRIATGQVTDLDLLESVHMRDVAGEQMAKLETAELLKMAVADQERTLKTLRSADTESLQRSARIADGMAMTAEEFARLPLIGHLEMHVDQLERLLAGDPQAASVE